MSDPLEAASHKRGLRLGLVFLGGPESELSDVTLMTSVLTGAAAGVEVLNPLVGAGAEVDLVDLVEVEAVVDGGGGRNTGPRIRWEVIVV